MCGQIGILRQDYGTNTIRHKDLFSTMLFADYVRGKDSTGVAIVHTNRITKGGEHENYLYKRSLASYDFMFLPGYGKAMSFTRPVLLMGHNRASTRGAVINSNAHPFKVGNIILTHNGTLTNKHSLPDEKFFGTDSENIAHLINEKGVEATANLIEGAWALVWWNIEDKSLNFYRNKERPLHYCLLSDGKTLMYSSEENLLRFTCEHNKETMEDEDAEHIGSVYATEEGTLYTFNEGETEPVCTKVEIKPKPKPAYNYGPGYWKQQSRKDARKLGETERKKKILDVILGNMVGESIPFIPTAAHSYTNKGVNNDSGVFISGKLCPDFSDRVFPELKDIRVTVNARTKLELGEVNSKFKTFWMGNLANYHVYGDCTTVSLKMDNVSSFPQYSVDKALANLAKEETPEKKNLYVTGPEGIQIPFTDFTQMVSCGCAGCLRPLTINDADSIRWVEGGYPVCTDCYSTDEDVKRWADNFSMRGV